MPRQAKSLNVFLAEVNAHAPKRSKASDGGLGDAAHSARTSDHNPNAAGVWTARDITQDIAGGMSCGELANILVRKIGKHPALMAGAYIIWSGRIYSYNRRAEGWREYTGTNPHTKHLHLSVSDAALGYDSPKPWNLWAPKPTHWSKVRSELIKALNSPDAAAIEKKRTAIRAALATIRTIVNRLPKR